MKDALAYAIVAHLHGKLFLLASDGLRGGYDTENLVKLAIAAKDFNVNKIWIEDNFGDGMFTALLKPVLNSIYPCGVEDIKNRTQKEVRIIDTLEPVMNQHRLVVDKRLVERDIRKALSTTDNQISYSLFYQMTHISRDKGSLVHDDSLDVLALVVAQWMRILVQNPDVAYQRYKDKQLETEIDKFVRRHTQRQSGVKARLIARKW